MIKRVPDYYDDFECVGSACKDNCCIGWEIDIDEKTLQKYKKTEGDFLKRLKSGIRQEGTSACFAMDEKKRCVFLNDQNLCDIFIHLGKDALCDICTEHPRYHGVYGFVEESGIGIACDTAARFILERKLPVKFVEKGTVEAETDQWAETLFFIREHLIRILQDRRLPVWQRMSDVLSYAEEVQKLLNKDCPDLESLKNSSHTSDIRYFQQMKSPEYLCRWTEIYRGLQMMDEKWAKLLDGLLENQAAFQRMDLEDVFYEQLSVYFIFRHFMKAYDDYNVIFPVKFAILGCMMISALSQNHYEDEETDRCDIARMYSKEIEYSEENLEEIFEEFLFDTQE